MTPHRVARASYWLTGILLGTAVALLAYILAPVDVVTLESQAPLRVGPEQVQPGATLRWVRPGATCWPDGDVLMLQEVQVRLADGSEWSWPTVGPRINRHGACSQGNSVVFVLPENFTLPSEFRIQFRFCSNAGNPLRERCTEAYSPTYTLIPEES